MNAEQKQRMAHELGQWNAAMKSSCSVTDLLAISTRMAALLHELIDASYNAPPGAKWRLGDTVQKVRGSKWRGKVAGFYSTEATPIGYSVESAFEPGSVQVWPEAALIEWDGEK